MSKPKRRIGWLPIVATGIPALLGVAAAVITFASIFALAGDVRYYDMPGTHELIIEEARSAEIALVTSGKPNARGSLPPGADVRVLDSAGSPLPLRGTSTTSTYGAIETSGLYIFEPPVPGTYRLEGSGTSAPFTVAIGPGIGQIFVRILGTACGGSIAALCGPACVVLLVLRYVLPPKA